MMADHLNLFSFLRNRNLFIVPMSRFFLIQISMDGVDNRLLPYLLFCFLFIMVSKTQAFLWLGASVRRK